MMREYPALGRIALYAIPNISVNIGVSDIGPLSIRLRSNRSYWLRDPLLHERFMLGAMQRLIQPGDIVFDVGANIGLYVRFIVQKLRAEQVIAFEPSSENCKNLRRNIRLGRCEDRTTILSMALADFDDASEFQTDNISTATGTLSVVTGGAPSEARRQYGLSAAVEMVKVARLDSLLETGAVPVPAVIKVDIEGAEERFLRGAADTLREYRPHLAIELHGADVSRRVVTFLLDLGYFVFGFLNNNGGKVYKELGIADLAKINSAYALHHCVASSDRELLRAPIQFES
jgi:FkbM family methyltransferase